MKVYDPPLKRKRQTKYSIRWDGILENKKKSFQVVKLKKEKPFKAENSRGNFTFKAFGSHIPYRSSLLEKTSCLHFHVMENSRSDAKKNPHVKPESQKDKLNKQTTATTKNQPAKYRCLLLIGSHWRIGLALLNRGSVSYIYGEYLHYTCSTAKGTCHVQGKQRYHRGVLNSRQIETCLRQKIPQKKKPTTKTYFHQASLRSPVRVGID